MKKRVPPNRTLLALVGIFLISFCLRFLYLGDVPVALSHDETDNIIEAHAVIHTGTDIVGTWHPLSFLPNGGVMAELSPLINVPSLMLFPQSLWASRATTAFLSSLFPLLIWGWLRLLGGERSVALLVALLLSISPWHLIFSRTALEASTSLFFYFLSWICLALVSKSDKTKRMWVVALFSFMFTFAIGFFTYHGYKFSFPVMTTIYLAWLVWEDAGRHKLRYCLALIFIALLLVRTLVYARYYQSRQGEIILFDDTRFATSVNLQRRQSVAPDMLKSLFVNKPTVLFSLLRDKYLMSFSPDILFLHGEANGVFSVGTTGYLYLITAPFLLFGIWYLCTRWDKHHLLLLALAVVSPLATVIHANNSLVFRSASFFVFLNILAAYGIGWSGELLARKNRPISLTLKTCFLALVLSSTLAFCYAYYFVTPVTSANDYFFGDRVMANYVRLNPTHKILLFEPQPRYAYAAITLARGKVSRTDIDSFGKSYSPADLDHYQVGNLTITRDCPPGVESYDTILIAKILQENVIETCPAIHMLQKNLHESPHALVSPKDSGLEHSILGDTLCQSAELGTYVHPTHLSDFALETMTKEQFCAHWVVTQL